MNYKDMKKTTCDTTEIGFHQKSAFNEKNQKVIFGFVHLLPLNSIVLPADIIITVKRGRCTVRSKGQHMQQ